MKNKRLFPIIMASLMSISMMTAFPMGAWAAGSNYTGLSTDTTGNNISINTTTLTKNLVIEDNANIPACSFKFTASAGAAVAADADAGTLAVLAGVNPEAITYKLVTASNNTLGAVNTDYMTVDTTVTGKSSVTLDYASQDIDLTDINPTDNVVVNNIADDTYLATKTIQLDFSQCGFTEPGVYRYIITEDGTNQGVTNDTNSTRTIDVYVEDATTDATGKKLKIAGYVMYVGTVTGAPSNNNTNVTNTEDTSTKLEDGTTNKNTNGNEVTGATKSVGFQNTYTTHDLTFGKEVTGNQGSKDKYFKFTVNITGAVAGTIYDVDISKADTNVPDTNTLNSATKTDYASKANTETITVGTDGTVSTDFYLQDGQYITIKGLAEGTKYEITEVAEDYKSTAGIEQQNSTFKISADTDYIALNGAVNSTAGITEDIFTGYTNDRTGTIPTGIILSVAPTAIIGLALVGGIVFLIIRNKKRKYEE